MAYTRKVKIRPTLIKHPEGRERERESKPVYRLTGQSWPFPPPPSTGIAFFPRAEGWWPGAVAWRIGDRVYDYELSGVKR
jgi:hypothetical protein